MKFALQCLALLINALVVEAQGNWDPGALDLNYIDAFKMMRSDFAWPCQNAPRHRMSSPFGPRMYNTGRDSFHRGFDIAAEIDGVEEDLYAVYDGVVDGTGEWGSGGFYTVIKHNFTDPLTGLNHTARLHPDGPRTEKWYTLYLHMKEQGRPATGAVVKAGDYIGIMSDSGTGAADGYVHLHLEIRIGTRCSLSYALNNPTSTCNVMGYDPHINPMLCLPYLQNPEYQRPNVDQTKELSATTDGELFVYYHDEQTYGNGILFEQVAADGTVRASHKLDFNRRTGFDATSTEAIATWDKTKPFVRPIRFQAHHDFDTKHIVIPRMFVCKKYPGDLFRVTFDSTWDTEETRLSFWFGESADEWDTRSQWGPYCAFQ